MKILVLDDEESVRDCVKNLILDYCNPSAEVYLADCTGKALLLAEECRPDIIITDWNVPKVGGIEFIYQARKFVPSAIFIGMSGDPDIEIPFFEAGASFFILKGQRLFLKQMKEILRKIFANTGL